VDHYRSSDFSLDPTFAPEELFLAVDRAESRTIIAEAFTAYLESFDLVPVTRAIAIYVRASRQRGHSVEHVVRHLDAIQSRLESAPHLVLTEPSELRRAVLRGVLLSFYGPDAVRREDRRRAERRSKLDH
jgi:hypothetical protein